MKILIASHACALAQNQQLFALAAKRRRWQVTMVIPRGWKNEYGQRYEAKLLPDFDARLVVAPVIMNGSVPLHAYRMRATRLLKQLQPDAVYCHNEAYALSTMQWCRANAVTGDRPFGFFSCQNIVKRYPPPFRQGEALVYENSSFFFPITTAVDLAHRQKGYRGASTVIPLGFDPRMYAPSEDVPRRHLNASGPLRLAYVGRIVEEKGLLTLAKALGKVRDISWRLTMIGAGPFEAEVKSAFQEERITDRVEWRGFVPHDQVARFFETVHVLLLPSETRPNWKEQFGRVLVESMACGTPVIGSDSGEIPSIIEQTTGGLIFKEADAESFAQAIREMLTHSARRAQLAEAGLTFVHQNYALPVLAERFADAIESAVAG